MDEVSPDFSSTVVKTRSWTDTDCDQVEEQSIETGTSSPSAFTTSSQIAKANSVVVNTIPVEEEFAHTETDCSVADVFTPRFPSKQHDTSPEATRTIPCNVVQQPDMSTLSTSNCSATNGSHFQPPSRGASISTNPENLTDEVKAVEPIQASATAEATPSPMPFGSFVASRKADPNIVVQLEAADLWHQFYQAGTEMIITKSGR